VEEEPAEALRAASRRARAIDRIARDGMTDGIEVDPDLVGPPGDEIELEQRPALEPLANAIASHGWATVRHDRHLRAVLRVAADRRLDAPGRRRDRALHECLVGLLDAARLELGHDRRLGGVIPGDHEQAARVAVEAVDDARPLDAGDAAPRIARAVRQQRVHE